MKLFAFTFLAFIASPAFADGNCVSQPNQGAHEDFCNKLNVQTCGSHSALCTWDASEPKFVKMGGKNLNMRVKATGAMGQSCKTKPGMEVHEPLCGNLIQATCAAHSMCRWE